MLPSSSIRPSRVWTPLSLVVMALSAIQPVQAAIYTVGTGTGCTHTTIQAAVNAAQASPGDDTVRITRSASWTQQALLVNTGGQDLNIVGGFATCTQTDGDGFKTVLDGAGGALASVLRITGGGIVKLRHLTIRNGDVAGEGYGGGIYVNGNGILEIIESTIQNNTAGYGGGIYLEGTGPAAQLIISADVLILSNTARYSGGGIYVDGGKMTMDAPGSMLAFNEAVGVGNAGGYGGGVQIIGAARDSCATIGSPGVPGLGPIYANKARRGGGVSVIGANDSTSTAELALYSTTATQTVIRNNFATIAGGGVFVWARGEFGTALGGYFGRAALRNASLIDNAAADGAAAFVRASDATIFDASASLTINTDGFLCPTAVAPLPCPNGRPCSYITGNVDQDSNGQPTGGAVLVVGEDNRLLMERTELSGNRGGRMLRGDGGGIPDEVKAVNTLWVGNVVSQELIRVTNDADLVLENSSFAGNVIGAANVINANGRFRLQGAVLWQPGKTSLVHGGGTLFAQNVVTSESFSLGGGSVASIVLRDPRFIDSGRDDYRLRAASPAVDFADTGGGPDLVGNPRDIDLPIKANRNGSADLGAFERPALLPLVLNADFDVDLNLWPEATAGVSSWTSDQNVVGAPGSGSVLVSQQNIAQARVTARSHCIHLPGPGRYRLNGWGRSGFAPIGTRDSVLLHWQLRHVGQESCNNGPPNASGDHVLTTSNSWVQPAQPAIINVSEANWTDTSSITVLLTVIDNGITSPPTVTGWFDGITLDVDGGDVIFANGFDQ